MQRIYLDNNSTTRPAPEVLEAMIPWIRDRPANPSSPHPAGEMAADAVRAARGQVARLIGATASEITFTSGASESIAAAFWSSRQTSPDRRRLVVSSVEHSAVKRNAERAAAAGLDVIEIPVDGEGCLDRDLLLSAIDGPCSLVSLILANNETGAVSDLSGIGAACRQAGALFHVDAVQAPGKLPLDVNALECDLLSLSAHKLHGPGGVGVLFVRAGQPFEPLIVGGPQENERRAGTENVAGIVGLGVAADLARAHATSPERLARLAGLRDTLEQSLLAAIPGARAHCAGQPRVPSTCNIYLGGLDAGLLLALIGEGGVDASAGSACNATSTAPSPVLLAMGCSEGEASGSLRFSLSRETTSEEIARAAEVVVDAVETLSAL